MSSNKKFNFLNFFYGLGATVILVAAMFKFLGWRYANTIFIVGILVEASVFFISAFDWGEDTKGYQWERVFPQLDDEDNSSNISSIELAEGTQQQQIQKIMGTVMTLNSSVTELNNATEKLTKSVSMMEKNYRIVTESTHKYQVEIDNLRNKISGANDRLKDFEKFNFNKNL
ncbi:MAG: gliding motility-associated protein GldL [Bacteroidia bacterium]|jgi:gliding motility-associated protein GldL